MQGLYAQLTGEDLSHLYVCIYMHIYMYIYVHIYAHIDTV